MVRISLFAAFLAGGGIPLYVHLPQYVTGVLGLSLSTLSMVLVAIRFIDTLQDPLLGRLSDRYSHARPVMAGLAVLGMVVGFVLLYVIRPAEPTGGWLLAVLTLLFTAYSLATILFYGRGVELAARGGAKGHLRLAGFREAGTLIGVLIAVSFPQIVEIGFGWDGYLALGGLLAVGGVFILVGYRGFWQPPSYVVSTAISFRLLKEAHALPVLRLALVNALPVAITSTLFLFFVEDRLQLATLSGAYLLLFFLSAGISVPLWTRLAQVFGARKVLLFAMWLAIVSFIGAAALPTGAVTAFALICAASGAALGADMVILPALFSVRLDRSNVSTGIAFGLWAFVAKLALTVAAVLVLPMLDFAGFKPGQENSASALRTLNWAYAILPCLLKLCAIWMLARLPETPLAENS